MEEEKQEERQEVLKRNFTAWNLVSVLFIILLVGVTGFFVSREFMGVPERVELRNEADSFFNVLKKEFLMNADSSSKVSKDSVAVDVVEENSIKQE